MPNNIPNIPEPIARREIFLAAAAGMDIDLPDPISRVEIYLKAIAEKGGGGVEFRKVDELPETGEEGVIYLVPKASPKTQDVYDEYIWQDSAWEKIGTTEIPLSNYYTKDETDELLDDKQPTISDLETIRSGAALGATALQSVPNTYYTKTETDEAIQAAIGDAMQEAY